MKEECGGEVKHFPLQHKGFQAVQDEKLFVCKGFWSPAKVLAGSHERG
jgi:hypothetical protein